MECRKFQVFSRYYGSYRNRNSSFHSSECTSRVEVTHGVNTATDQIKAKTISDSYWAEYQAGFDIKIGDVVINKFDYPDAKLLQDGETVPATGVYFIADGATVKKSGPCY